MQPVLFTILNYLYNVHFFLLGVLYGPTLGKQARITAAGKRGVSLRMWLSGMSKLPEMAFAQD